MATKVEVIAISKIKRDAGTQTRAKMDAGAVKRYSQAYQAEEKLPPVVVFQEGEDYWLGDGWHRIAGLEMLTKEWVDAEVRVGGKREALLYAAGCNSEHGLPRSNEDKRKAVRLLLKDPEWAQAADNWIAETCRVSDTFVTKMRKSTSNVGSQTSNRTGKDGRTYKPRKKKVHEPCERCARLDSPSCDECKKKFPKGFPSKNGKAKWGWKAFEAAFGTLVRQIDELGSAHGAKNSVVAGDLRAKLKEWKERFKEWHKTLSGRQGAAK